MRQILYLSTMLFGAIAAMGWYHVNTEIAQAVQLQGDSDKLIGRMAIDLAHTHLLIEESLAGDSGINRSEIQESLASLEKDMDAIDAGISVHAETMGPDIAAIRKQLNRFIGLAVHRLEHPSISMPGSPIDEQFDELFQVLLEKQHRLEGKLNVLTSEHLQKFQRLQALIAILFFVFVAVVLVILSRYNRKLSQAIDESRLSEKRSRISEASLARAQQIAHIGNWDWDIKADTLVWSDEIYRIFGMKPQQFEPSYKAFLMAVHPDDRNKLEEAVQLAVTGNKPYNINHRIVLPNGKIRFVHEQGEIEFGDDGDPERMIGTVQDITERYMVEQEIEKLFGAIKQAGEIIVITDHMGVIEYVNPAFTRITGYTSGEAIGKNPSILKSDLQDPSYYQEMWETISRGNIWKGTLIDRKKDGSYFPVMMTVSPVKNDQGVITHYISVQQDMSEHQLLEEQLRQSQKMEALGTLVGGIAHDFNNMLAGVLGNTYLIRSRRKKGQDFDDLLDAIDEYGNSAADMIKQMLTFARNDSIELKPLNLSQVMHETCKLVRSGIPESIACSFKISDDTLKVMGDVTQIQNLLLNLANNARDAVADVEQPVIEVSLQRFDADQDFMLKYPQAGHEAYARIAVRDNGSGINPEHIKRIFDPFFTTKGVNKGTGLGLSMVYGAIQRHDGIIDVDSVSGEFTEFNIYLPLTETLIETSSAGADILIDSKGQTILLADDEPALRDVHAKLLADLGFQVIQADDGLSAVELFEANREDISLAILDVVMPNLSGVEAALRINEIAPELPIIFVTGYDLNEALSSTELPKKYLALQKPFTVNQLAEKMRLAMTA